MFATAKMFLQKVLAPGQLGTAQTFVLAGTGRPRTRTPLSQQLTRIGTEDENARGVGQAWRSSDRPEQGEGRMLVNNTALVSETRHVSSAQLAKVSAAL